MYLVQLPQTGCNSLLGPSEALYVTGDASIWSLVVVNGQAKLLFDFSLSPRYSIATVTRDRRYSINAIKSSSHVTNKQMHQLSYDRAHPRPYTFVFA